MKRIIISLLAGAVLGGVVGFAAGIFIYPYWFLTDVAMEEVADRASKTVLATGSFIHVDTADPVHWGTGTVTLFQGNGSERLVHLEQDFEVGPGPRFHVYLVSHADVRSGDDFRTSEMVDLGRLHAFKGSQSYAIPADVDLARYQSVVIWCKEFGVLISPASLTSAAASPQLS
jgi:hypothetical protein